MQMKLKQIWTSYLDSGISNFVFGGFICRNFNLMLLKDKVIWYVIQHMYLNSDILPSWNIYIYLLNVLSIFPYLFRKP